MVKPKHRHRTSSSNSVEDVKRKKHKPHKRSESPEHSDAREYERRQNDGSQAENKPAEKPNFQLSGRLADDSNTFRGVIIRYYEPLEARKPKKRWRLYPLKNDEAFQVLHVYRQSAYLIGQDRLVADIPVDHPSCSKQHAVLQYRMVDLKREDGTVGKRVAPYIIDLDSSNGTYVNNEKIEPRSYVELFERDVIKFGYSSREYVLLHERSGTSEVGEAGESP